MAQAGPGDTGGCDRDDGGWEIIDSVGLDRHLGPYWRRMAGEGAVYRMVPDDRHLNILGIVHGGTLIALLDSVMGLEAKRLHDAAGMVTIQLDCSLIEAARAGQALCASARLVSATRSLIFMQGEVRAGGRMLASATGIWKRINPATIGRGA